MPKLKIFSSYEELSDKASDAILACIRQKPGALLCFAAGDTPKLTLEMAVEKIRTQNIPTTSLTFVGLDEWVGIAPENEGSCQYFFRKYWTEALGLKDDQFHFFNALSADLIAECSSMDAFIRERGGIDFVLVGLGMNGHIGFNEPGTAWSLFAHVANLDQVTQQVGQKYFREETNVAKGISLGFGWLQSARRLMLLANGAKKASIVKEMLEGPVSTQVPASILQTLSDAEILLDQESSSLIHQLPGHEME
jgi:glucosamine-6-phosphate isomerase